MEQLIETLLCINYYKLDTDQILNERDSKAFDLEWKRVFDAVESLKNADTYTAANKEYTDKVRENIFGKIYRRSGDGELAEYISDDFGLIADSFIVGYKDQWLDKLIECYRKAEIPTGCL